MKQYTVKLMHCVVLLSGTINFVSKSSATGKYLFLYATNSITKIFRIVYKLLSSYMKAKSTELRKTLVPYAPAFATAERV
jgi:hypothetical protein